MEKLSEHGKKMEQDIVISRASVTKANERKEQLDELIAATATKVLNQRNNMTTIEAETKNSNCTIY